MKTLFPILIMLLLLSPLSAQRPGDLNTDFGNEGIYSADWGDTMSLAFGIVTATDGSLLISGAHEESIGHDFQYQTLVMKLNEQGQYSDFGNFRYGFECNMAPFQMATAIKVLPDDKILVAGLYLLDPTSNYPFVIRLLPNGEVDETFGESGFYLEDLTQMRVLDMDVYQQGDSYSIIMCGVDNDIPQHPLMIMINDAGEIDPSFGILGFTDYQGVFTDLEIDNEHGIVYAAGSITGGGALFTKHNLSDGSPDTDFGEDGILCYMPADGFSGSVTAIVYDEEDSTLTAFGDYGHADGDDDIYAYRFHANNCTDDVSFGISGWSSLRLSGPDEYISSAILQSDGKYYFGGCSNTADINDFFLGRINHNGFGDTTFGANGLVLTSMEFDEKIQDIALSPEEDILYAAGYSEDPYFDTFIRIAAYHTTEHIEPPVTIGEVAADVRLCYPNPSSGTITILTGKTGDQQLQVYDLTGKRLYTGTFTDRRAEFDLGFLQSSVYLILVILPDMQVIAEKWIKQ